MFWRPIANWLFPKSTRMWRKCLAADLLRAKTGLPHDLDFNLSFLEIKPNCGPLLFGDDECFRAVTKFQVTISAELQHLLSTISQSLSVVEKSIFVSSTLTEFLVFAV